MKYATPFTFNSIISATANGMYTNLLKLKENMNATT